jgi:hypothetical protein
LGSSTRVIQHVTQIHTLGPNAESKPASRSRSRLKIREPMRHATSIPTSTAAVR